MFVAVINIMRVRVLKITLLKKQKSMIYGVPFWRRKAARLITPCLSFALSFFQIGFLFK